MKNSKVFAAAVAVACPPALAQSADVIPLGNLFDDVKGTSLSTAIQSDVYMAGATGNSLGVNRVQVGGLGSLTEIAPGVMFDTGFVGGVDSPDSGARPGNDALSSINSIGLSCSGQDLYGQTVFGRVDDGIGMWADQLITFDLNEIRVAGGFDADQMFNFSSFAGINDYASPNATLNLIAVLSNDSGVIGGWMNGEAVSFGADRSVWSFDGDLPGSFDGENRASSFNFTVGGDAKYLTIASLSLGDGSGTDHGVFGGAALTAVPAPSTLMLGGMGLVALRRRRR